MAGAKLFITPELAICGYSAADLFLRPDFHQQIKQQLERFKTINGITIVIGTPWYEQSSAQLFNSACVFRDGVMQGRYDKNLLPNYGVFDEKRYFTAGTKPLVIDCEGISAGILICEDVWGQCVAGSPSQIAAESGAEILCVLNASPFHTDKHAKRLATTTNCVSATGLPLIYVNYVAGEDDIIFDGASFALDGSGEISYQAAGCREELFYVEVTRQDESGDRSELSCHSSELSCHSSEGWNPLSSMSFQRRLESIKPSVILADTPVKQEFQGVHPYTCHNVTIVPQQYTAYASDTESSIYQALVLAIRDYITKNNFPGVIIGLSGGIDSALVLALAVDALGCERVMAVMLPSAYTADISIGDAREMASNLQVSYTEIAINPVVESFEAQLQSVWGDVALGVTEENLQARTRGTMLMALSNRLGYLLLSTSNKSELATGYATLYGDMAGGFAPIKDILKTGVYALASWRNSQSMIIPQRIIDRPPSAELRPNQTDQDTLPDYASLDSILRLLIEQKLSVAEITEQGFANDVVKQVAHLLKGSEYKRAQAVIGPKISPCTLGKEWRYPLTNKFKY